MDQIELDTLTPSSMSYLVDRRNDFILQHGGVATRVHFDTVTVMDLEGFLKAEVPKLKTSDDNLLVLRDTNTNQVSLIYKDQVIKYHVTGLEDVCIDELSKLLQTNEPKRFYPDIRYPLVGYVETETCKVITVYIGSHKIHYIGDHIAGGLFEDDIYLPPIWFRVKVNSAKSILGCGIAIVTEQELHTTDTKLYQWVLPNVHASGEVCLGSSHLEVSSLDTGDDITDGVCIQRAYSQVFSSHWNIDLTWDIDYKSIIGNVYESLPVLDMYKTRLDKNNGERSTCGLLRTLRVLRDPGGYLRLNYARLNVATDRFLTAGISR